MKLPTTILLLAMIASATTSTAGGQTLLSQPRADIIFLNANIYTGVDTSSFHAVQRAEAMAVRDGRVEAVGRNDEIVKLKGPSTEVINLALYRLALQNFDIGAAAALGIVFLIFLSVIMTQLLGVLGRNTDILEG